MDKLDAKDQSKSYCFDSITNNAERNLLEAFALFPEVALNQEKCVQWLYEDAGINEVQCSRLLNKLSQSKWLISHTNDETGKDVSYSMCSIAQKAITAQTTIAVDNHGYLITKHLLGDISWDHKDTFKKAQPYIVYAEAITQYFYLKNHVEDEAIATLIFWLGKYYADIAKFSEAMKWHEIAQKIREAVLGKDHPDTARTYNGIAVVCDKQGKYDLALEWYEKAQKIYEHLNPESEKTARIYNGIAFMHYMKGAYSKALEWYEKAQKIYEKELGKDHLDTVWTYNGTAFVYERQGYYNKAMYWHEVAREIREKELGKDHPETAWTYNGIAVVHYKQGDYSEALDWYKKALAIFENVFGTEHQNTAWTYNGIASMYYRSGDYSEALKWYEKAQKIYERVLGKDHPETAWTYNGIAFMYYKLHKYPAALKFFIKAQKIREAVLGKDHPDTARTYNGMASVYRAEKDYNKALEWYEKAITIIEKALTKAHPDTASFYNNIASVYFNRDNDKAKEYFTHVNRCYELMKERFGVCYTSDALFVENAIEEIAGVLRGKELISAEAASACKSVKDKKEGEAILKLIADTDEMHKEIIKEKERINKTFFSKDNKKPPSTPIFEVLRRWNSYTPLVGDIFRASKGGGYFYKVNDCGIVIDPGFNFIENFKSAKHQFNEIDHVLVTHAHSDHTADIESILTLLHEYNKDIIGDYDYPGRHTIMRKLKNDLSQYPTAENRGRIEEEAKEKFLTDPRRKRICIYMTASTYKQYANILDLYSKNNYDIIIIKEGDGEQQLKYPGNEKRNVSVPKLSIEPIRAKHTDMLSDRDSIGFLIKYDNFFLIYTGDTGFDHDVATTYEKIKSRIPDHGKIVLLAHLGGFKHCERAFKEERNNEENSKAFYRSHLGRLGIAKLVGILKPKICIISEFGEEFKEKRIELANSYNKFFSGTKFFASELNFAINSEGKINAIISAENIEKQRFIKPENVLPHMHPTKYSLYYYKKGLKKDTLVAKINQL